MDTYGKVLFYVNLQCYNKSVLFFSRVAKTVNIGESKIFHLPREKCYSFSFKRYFFYHRRPAVNICFCLCPKISKHLYSNRYFLCVLRPCSHVTAIVHGPLMMISYETLVQLLRKNCVVFQSALSVRQGFRGSHKLST